MTLLITGGSGFVLSNLARAWLARDPAATCVVLDAAPCDELAQAFFAPVQDRLTFIQADIRQPAAWEGLLSQHVITHVVHGAAVTPSLERERRESRFVLEINLMGTVNLLEWACRQPSVKRFIYVSSGAVYGDSPTAAAEIAIREDAPTDPRKLYAISKLASEQIVRRYGELFGLEVASVRFSSVYGPMDRVTPARSVQSLPYRLAHLALAGDPIRVYGLEGGGDWIHAEDVAAALIGLLCVPALPYGLYNVAYSEFVTLGELLEIMQVIVPGLEYTVSTREQADVAAEPERHGGGWGAYDISRLREVAGWEPRPLREALARYVSWLRRYEMSKA
jgi:nucleoside-diphosphate-sugar epimerase